MFPKLILDGNWIEYPAEKIIDIFKDTEAPKHVKDKILNKYKNYWKVTLGKAQKNLNILKTGKKVYKV